MTHQHRINDQIRTSPVRVVDKNGTTVGVMPIADAQRLAVGNGLDLVEVAPNLLPPVCRIMDYDKFKRDQMRRDGTWN